MAETIKTKLDGCMMICGTATLASGTVTIVTGLNRVLCVQATYGAASATTELIVTSIANGSVTITGSDYAIYYTIIGI